MTASTITTADESSTKKDIWSIMKKGVSNCKAITVTSSKNTKETIKIQQAKLKMVERKKAFGVEYMDLMEQQASCEELDSCLDQAIADIERLREKMTRWEGLILQNKEKLERKLHSSTTSSSKPSCVEDSSSSDDSEDSDNEDDDNDNEDVDESSDTEEIEEEGVEIEAIPHFVVCDESQSHASEAEEVDASVEVARSVAIEAIPSVEMEDDTSQGATETEEEMDGFLDVPQEMEATLTVEREEPWEGDDYEGSDDENKTCVFTNCRTIDDNEHFPAEVGVSCDETLETAGTCNDTGSVASSEPFDQALEALRQIIKSKEERLEYHVPCPSNYAKGLSLTSSSEDSWNDDDTPSPESPPRSERQLEEWPDSPYDEAKAL